MRSTANYIGVIERDGKMRAANVLFDSKDADANAPQEATVDWFAPMPVGFRQLPVERWVVTPIYRIKTVDGLSAQGIERPVTMATSR